MLLPMSRNQAQKFIMKGCLVGLAVLLVPILLEELGQVQALQGVYSRIQKNKV